MATLFVDLEAGNDNYAGTSFSVLASGTDGRISSTTFSSATASFPNDGSLIDQYLSIWNGTIYAVYRITAWVSSTSLTIAAISGGTALANQTVDRQFYIGGRWKSLTNGATAVRLVAGDTVRVMGSPAPTSLGINGTWTSGVQQATKSISGATNATPISITCNAHGYSTGDTVVISSVNGNTAANGTWEITSTGTNTFTLDGSVGNAAYTSGGSVRLRNNTVVRLASALTANIASTGPRTSAWTAANANVTTALITQTKEHYQSDSITVATAFTTGKAAYYTLPSTLDLSGYQQVSFWFWFQQGTGSWSAGQLDFRLCSDSVGDVPVNTISIPAVPAQGRWQAFTVDVGSALGSNINSIALYINTDLSTSITSVLYLNNIIACKASSAADSLTLTSLIGKNVEGETFWGIQSINGTRVMLDADTNAAPTSTHLPGYRGTSETVTTWKRETIKLAPAAVSASLLEVIREGGLDGSVTSFVGGWDRTNMSTQNLETWLDGQNGLGALISLGSLSFISLSNIAGVRVTSLLISPGNYNSLDLIAGNNCTPTSSQPVIPMGPDSVCTIGHIVAPVQSILLGYSSFSPSTLFIKYLLQSTSQRPVELSTRARVIGTTSGAMIAAGTSTADQFRIGQTNGTMSGFLIKDLIIEYSISATSAGDFFFDNVNFTNSTEVIAINTGAVMYSQNHDKTPGNHKIFVNGGQITTATDQRKTASGVSWKMQPTSISTINSAAPLRLPLAKVACSANNLVTVKAWMRRTNTALTMRLVCKGGQLAGVSSDVVASMTAAADTWEELTITFTPTEIGVVEITAEAWGGSTHSGWVDDMTITQA